MTLLQAISRYRHHPSCPGRWHGPAKCQCTKLTGPKKRIKITGLPECPACHKSLVGKPIPRKLRAAYGYTHYKLEIGLYDITRDRTTHWQCPWCKHMWERT